MKQRLTKSKRRQSRRLKKRSFSRKKQRRTQRQRGGADLPVPRGSVVAVDLDPKDAYSVPVLLTKETYEDEVLED